MLLVEVLDRRGRVRERVRLDRFPLYVGRAYSNEVILEDRFVSPVHLVVREDESGTPVACDLDSLNGSWLVEDGRRVNEIPIESGLRMRLGETMIRFVRPDHLVAPAELLSHHSSELLSKLKDGRLAALVVLGSLGVFLADAYLTAYSASAWTEVFGPPVMALMSLGLWAGTWAFANRLLTHRFDFLRHWAIACLASAVMVLAVPASEYAQFVTSWEDVGLVFLYLGSGVLLALLIYGHLSIIPSASPGRRRWWSLGASGALLGLSAFFVLTMSQGFSTDVEYDIPLKSFGSEWIPAGSVEEFLSSARETKDWVDAQISSR
ncbi:MAG TPA: FHA domain-containing protein [Vicinamibacteria bacterium]|nr:FHA domain-containing protein [Vicinamibacteria bacterium]